METIELEDALELFKLPRVLGDFEGEEVKANIGRYGPYVQHAGKFYSLGKEQDPHTVTLEEAGEVIRVKREEDKNKYIKEFEEEGIQVLNGRYGPYIKQGRKNFKIPAKFKAEELTLEECREIITSTPVRKRKRKGK